MNPVKCSASELSGIIVENKLKHNTMEMFQDIKTLGLKCQIHLTIFHQRGIDPLSSDSSVNKTYIRGLNHFVIAIWHPGMVKCPIGLSVMCNVILNYLGVNYCNNLFS